MKIASMIAKLHSAKYLESLIAESDAHMAWRKFNTEVRKVNTMS